MFKFTIKLLFWCVLLVSLLTYAGKKSRKKIIVKEIPEGEQLQFCKSELENRLFKLVQNEKPLFSELWIEESPSKIEEGEFAQFASRKKSKTVVGKIFVLKAQGKEKTGVRNIYVRCGFSQKKFMTLTYEMQDFIKNGTLAGKPNPFVPVMSTDLVEQEEEMEKQIPAVSSAQDNTSQDGATQKVETSENGP